MASIRGNMATRSVANNAENDPVARSKASKATLDIARMKTTRGVMQEIGNTDSLQTRNPEIKPVRGLAKQKATVCLRNAETAGSGLQAAVSTRVLPKRKAAVKPTIEVPMDVSKPEDIEMEEVEPMQIAYSSSKLPLVDDIDKDDQADPQLVTDYVNDIYVYLRQLEKQQFVAKDYLAQNKGGAIVPKMRTVLVDWLVDVHSQFSMLQETLYLTVAIMDRFLQKASSGIAKKSLQLVGVTAMLLASKYEEMYAPEIGDFVYITDGAYTHSQIREMEIVMLKTLNFELGRPLPLHFLRRNSKAGCVDVKVHTLAKYIMELVLVQYELVHVAPSKVAAASLLLSMKILDQDNADLDQLWTPTLEFYSGYPLSEIRDLACQNLGKMLVDVSKTETKIKAIRQKYSLKKNGKIAAVVQANVHIVEKIVSF